MSSEHGTFRLTYTPPEPTGHEDYPLITVDMSTSGDASVDQMLRLYEAFLAASGFMLKGEIQVVNPEPSSFVPFSSYDFGDDGFSLVGNPVYGATGTDTIYFG